MDENDFTQDEDLDTEELDEEAEESVEEPNEQSQKPRESDEARASRLLRQTNQARKRLGLAPLKDSSDESTKVEAKAKDTKSDGLDYGQKAFAVANGVKGKEELALVQEYMDMGKELEDIFDNRHFQNDLKDLRDGKEANAAIPKTTKRTGNKTADTVDYWLSKPFEEVPQNMRSKVLEARLQREKSASNFSSNSIVT
jgi:hypothetical protein